MILRQYVLSDPATSARLVCWLEHQPRVRPGTRITLKDFPDRTWVVKKIYQTERTDADMRFSRGWNNNI